MPVVLGTHCPIAAPASAHMAACTCDIAGDGLAGRRIGQGCFGLGIPKLYHRMPYKPKDLIGIPWRVAFALQADGWYLRQDIIWSKPNPMPESVTDRCTKAHEYLFLLRKAQRYSTMRRRLRRASETFGRQNTNGMSPKLKAKQELGHFSKSTGMVDPYAYENRNKRSVWTIATQPFQRGAFRDLPAGAARTVHQGRHERAGMLPALRGWMAKGGGAESPEDFGRGTTPKNQGQIGQQQRNALGPPGNGMGVQPARTLGFAPSCLCPSHEPVPATVLDPFAGAGTTGLVADRLGRDAILIELNQAYCAIGETRMRDDAPSVCRCSLSTVDGDWPCA